MILDRDRWDNITPPPYILCKASNERVGIIQCTKKTLTKKFNAYDEISFTTYLNMDGKKNNIYDLIKEGKFIELPLIGRYVISDVSVQSESNDIEYKECTALSSEVLLAQKYVENFVINMGTTESMDGVRFYHLTDPTKSLLDLVLEKCPDWEVGHIDTALIEKERCFEIDRQDVYNTLVNDIAEAFECVFLFDTVNQIINVYEEKNVGKDTDIFVSYDNLLKSTDISSSVEDIKTCLTVTGADDLNLREIYIGNDRIYNLEYFNSLEFMSQKLYDEYNAWIKKTEQYEEEYEALILENQKLYDDIYEAQTYRMPQPTENSEDWTKYSLTLLQSKLTDYEGVQATMIKQGQGDPEHADYQDLYLPCYNNIQAIKTQIEVITAEIQSLQDKQNVLSEKMAIIYNETSMVNNLSTESLKELSKFIREDELSSDNFVTTDAMTDSERIEMLQEMLKYAREELSKVAQPTLKFKSDIVNLFNIPEFKELSVDFEEGNYIHIVIRDDYIIKARILTMDVDWFTPENFNVTFSNVMKVKGSKLLTSVNKALDMAQSVSTSVSMNASSWNKANKESSDIMDMLANGLIAAGQSISTSVSDVVVDDRGIFVSNIPDSKHSQDRVFIGGSQILFSDDDWKTVQTGLGRMTYEKSGKEYEAFGLLARFVISGYIAGSTIEGNEIIGSTIAGGTITGTEFNNGNGTFSVSKDGKLVASSATVTGVIKANEGYIGGTNGFTIKNGKLYSGSKSTFSSTADGIYLGTDGIALGKNFSVSKDGILKSIDGMFTGSISGSNIYIYGGDTDKGEIVVWNKDKSKQIVLINKNGFFAGETYKRQNDSGERYILTATKSEVTIGDFNVHKDEDNVRQLFESYDGFTGMSPEADDDEKWALWAAWRGGSDYGFAVSQTGTVRIGKRNDGGYADIVMDKLKNKWGEKWGGVAYNIIELWDDVSGIKDRLDYIEETIEG